MTEQPESNQPESDKAWQEVGQNLQAFGESLFTALQITWESEEKRQNLQKIQTNLETMVDNLEQTAKDLTDSPEAHRLKENVKKAADSVRSSGQQTLHEARPHLLSSLRKLRNRMDQMINDLEEKTT